MKKGLLPTAIVLSVIQGCVSGPTPGTAPALKADLQPMTYFIGSRHCSGTFLKSGKAISSIETISVELSGGWVVLRHDDDPPNRFQALESWGYDTKTGRFVAYLYDNSGGVREFASPGWEGDSFTWTNVDTSTPKWDRFVFEKRPDRAYQFTYEVTADGNTWIGIDSLICK